MVNIMTVDVTKRPPEIFRTTDTSNKLVPEKNIFRQYRYLRAFMASYTCWRAVSHLLKLVLIVELLYFPQFFPFCEKGDPRAVKEYMKKNAINPVPSTTTNTHPKILEEWYDNPEKRRIWQNELNGPNMKAWVLMHLFTGLTASIASHGAYVHNPTLLVPYGTLQLLDLVITVGSTAMQAMFNKGKPMQWNSDPTFEFDSIFINNDILIVYFRVPKWTHGYIKVFYVLTQIYILHVIWLLYRYLNQRYVIIRGAKIRNGRIENILILEDNGQVTNFDDEEELVKNSKLRMSNIIGKGGNQPEEYDNLPKTKKQSSTA